MFIPKRRLIGYCHVCKIRSCARDKRIASCAHCDEFACRDLQYIINAAPGARATLEEIRKSK